MSGTYRQSYVTHEMWEVEVEVENVSSVERAQELVDLYAGMGEGRHDTDDGYVTVTRELLDSDDAEVESEEWEDDDEELDG